MRMEILQTKEYYVSFYYLKQEAISMTKNLRRKRKTNGSRLRWFLAKNLRKKRKDWKLLPVPYANETMKVASSLVCLVNYHVTCANLWPCYNEYPKKSQWQYHDSWNYTKICTLQDVWVLRDVLIGRCIKKHCRNLKNIRTVQG